MSQVVFYSTYLISWLLIGVGVLLAFRLVANLRRVATSQDLAVRTSPLILVALGAAVALVSIGAIYAGAYTFYNLVLVR